MMTQKEMEDYEALVETGITTPNELHLVKGLMGGTWSEVISNVCFFYTGYNDVNDAMQELEDY